MLRSNLRLNIGKAVGYNNKILIRNTDMKTGSNKDINKDVVYHQKSSGTPHQNMVGQKVQHMLGQRCT